MRWGSRQRFSVEHFGVRVALVWFLAKKVDGFEAVEGMM